MSAVRHRYGPRPLPGAVAAVGSTPLVRLDRIAGDLAPRVELWAKLEWFNPGGSVKDRPARQMLLDALAAGRVREGGAVIDATSGNTGVAYAWLAAALGLRCVLVMPGNVSHGRRAVTRTFGAAQVFSDPMEGTDGAIRVVREMVAAEPGAYFYPDQYSNPSNPKAHVLTTAREILDQTQGRVTHFVAGLGTTGTVMGTGQGLKAANPAIRVVAVQPDSGFHGLEGLKHLPSSLVPAIWRPEGIVDEILHVPTEESWELSDRLVREEGLACGHSSGAACFAALKVARSLYESGQGGCVVTLFPDRADRYFDAGRWDPAHTW